MLSEARMEEIEIRIEQWEQEQRAREKNPVSTDDIVIPLLRDYLLEENQEEQEDALRRRLEGLDVPLEELFQWLEQGDRETVSEIMEEMAEEWTDQEAAEFLDEFGE